MQIERLGPYQIVGKLGRGGMGTVFEGVNLETGEPAAVKLLSAALAEEEGFRGRFEAEIETLRKLNHPNIVRLFGFGEDDTRLFYAMELIDGNSLEEELGRGRRFDWREVVRMVIEICRALRHAHDRGVIHRDLKPGNLLLTTGGQVKLSDFGIARLFGNTRITSAGSVLGTAEYMSPEQAAGKPVDQRSDLYSLGAVMYVLLARCPVFRGNSLGEVIYKQQYERLSRCAGTTTKFPRNWSGSSCSCWIKILPGAFPTPAFWVGAWRRCNTPCPCRPRRSRPTPCIMNSSRARAMRLLGMPLPLQSRRRKMARGKLRSCPIRRHSRLLPKALPLLLFYRLCLIFPKP